MNQWTSYTWSDVNTAGRMTAATAAAIWPFPGVLTPGVTMAVASLTYTQVFIPGDVQPRITEREQIEIVLPEPTPEELRLERELIERWRSGGTS